MNAFLEAGIRMGCLIGKLEQLEQEEGGLRQRVAQLPPEQQFTFALMQTKSVERFRRTVSLEMLLQLTAGILEVTEESLREDLDEAVKIARERMEDLGAL